MRPVDMLGLSHIDWRYDEVREVCRQHNIAEQTLYRWRRQFGGMEVSDAERLRALQRKNAEVKRLMGELTLDNRMLKDVLGKNW
jgi:putative transposase